MITGLYRWLHRLFSRTGEKGEYSGGYWQDKVRRSALDLSRGVKGRVLEVGCGEGIFLASIAKENPGLEIYGVDNDERRLQKARMALKAADLSLQDATRVSFEDNYFDAVVCINVLFNMESMETVRRTLREMARVCKTGGRVIFDFRNASNALLSAKYRLAKYYDDTLNGLPLNTYSLEEMEAVSKESGLKILNKKLVGFPYEPLAPVIVIEAGKYAV